MEFERLARTNILVMDGGMGTMLMAAGLRTGQSPEEFMLERPEAVRSIHEDYAAAGAKILTTNTFGASSVHLSQFNLDNRVEEICTLAVELAREAGSDEIFVAGSIGPLGVYLPPFGEQDIVEAFAAFVQQAKALTEAGADLLIIETMTDLREAQLALRAAKSVVNIPIVAHLAFNEVDRTVTGTPPDVGAVSLGAMRPFVIGTNCGGEPQKMIENVRAMRRYWNGPLSAEPNAGVPETRGDNTVWPASPEDLAEIALELREAGANLIGSCCGSTPEHTAEIATALKGLEPLKFNPVNGLHITSRVKLITIGEDNPIRLVGERINPAGREKLREEMREGKMSIVRREAARQTLAGADVLDVNASVPEADEPAIMTEAVRAVGAASELPIFIDSPDTNAVRVGLEATVGRPIINSVSAKEVDIAEKLPLAAEFGAAIVVLPLDDAGIPDTPKGRLKLIEKITEAASKYGLAKENILADPIVMSAASGNDAASTTLETARLLKENGFFTVCGLSNISHGLPNRNMLNAAFLAQIAPYLDAVIANPLDESLMNILTASQLLVGRDEKAKKYTARFAGTREIVEEEIGELTLRGEILAGNPDSSKELTSRAIDESKPLDIIDKQIVPALREIGRLYEERKVFLPQVMGSATAAKAALSVLEPIIAKSGGAAQKPTIILATVAGDIHDIGKNLVGALLSAHGYGIIDLGKSVKTENILAEIKSQRPDGIGLSALMTTTMPAMGETVARIKSEYPELPVVVGGACISNSFAQRIGADAFAKDAIAAVAAFDKILGKS